MSSPILSSSGTQVRREFPEEKRNSSSSSSSSSISSTGSPVINRAQSLSFINPDPITKRRIAEDNTQLRRPYTRKNGEEPTFRPIANQLGGSSLGTVFEKLHKASSSTKPLSKWLGKVSIGDEATLTTCTGVSQVLERINTAAILEKLSYDLYREFGRRLFFYPKSFLSNQPIKDAFHPTDPYALDKKGIERCLRVMSQYVEGYEDLCKLSCLDGTSVIPIMEFIKKHKRPPEKVLTPDKREIPLIGLIPLIAVGRILGDIDCVGASGTNAGYRWIKTVGVITGIEIIKIDPGFCFQFFPEKNTSRAFNTFHQTNGTKFSTSKDLQIASSSNDVTISWDQLTPSQKEAFISVLFNATRYIHQEEVLSHQEVLSFLFHREGAFNRTPHEHLIPAVADKYSRALKTWLNDQLAIYADELREFKQNHPDRVLRARYVDAFWELLLPASDEAFPIRELFTQLTLISTVEKEKNQSTIQATLLERDALFEALERLDKTTTSIPLESLFAPLTMDGNKPIHKVLLVGGAGIGKTTLCQKIAHDWASGHLWQQYDFIFWLPLRKLNVLAHPSAPLAGVNSLDQWLARAIALIALKDPSLENKILELIRQNPQKCLVLFDGYDEAHPALIAALAPFFQQNRHPLLLTSRPGAAESLRSQVDRFVENSGFSDENIKTYVHKHFTRGERYRIDTSATQAQFFAAVRANRNLFAVAHIPLQLQMLCILWESGANRTGFPANSTSLYAKMIDQITLWHERRSNKSFSPVEKANLLEALGQIAYQGFKAGKLIIPLEIIQAQAQQSQVAEEDLLSLGILKKTADAYTFLHLTFQEYLIAYSISKKSPQQREVFILQHRYYPQFQLVMAFLGGLIAQQDKSVDRREVKHFLTTLHAPGADLIGIYQLELTLRCLNECADPEIEKWVEEKYHIYETLMGIAANGTRELYQNLFKICKVPDGEFNKTLAMTRSVKDKAFRLVTFLGEIGVGGVSPGKWREIFETLRGFIGDVNVNIRLRAIEAFIKLGEKASPDGWGEVFETLKGLLEDANSHVRDYALTIFVKLSIGAPRDRLVEVFKTLIFKRQREHVSSEDASRVSFHISMSLKELKETVTLERWSEILKALKEILGGADMTNCDREYAIRVLTSFVHKAPRDKWGEVFETLKEFLKPSYVTDICCNAISALGHLGEESFFDSRPEVLKHVLLIREEDPFDIWSQVFELLKGILKDKNNAIRLSATCALGNLGKRAPLGRSAEIFDLLRDTTLRNVYSVLSDVIEALGELGKRAPVERWSEVFETLKKPLSDPDNKVRLDAIKALGEFVKGVPPDKWSEAFETLKGSLSDPDGKVRLNAIKALGELVKGVPPAKWNEAFETLKGPLSDSDSEVRLDAIKVLGELVKGTSADKWSEVFEMLKRSLAGPDSQVRADTTYALGELGKRAPLEKWGEVFEMLKTPLSDPDSKVRLEATKALGEFVKGAPADRWREVFDEMLKRFLSDYADFRVRDAARNVFRKLVHEAPTDKWRVVFETLREALKDTEHRYVRYEVICGLRRLTQDASSLRSEEVIETLRGALRVDEPHEIRWTTTDALGEFESDKSLERCGEIVKILNSILGSVDKDAPNKPLSATQDFRDKLIQSLRRIVLNLPMVGFKNFLPDEQFVKMFIHVLMEKRKSLYIAPHSNSSTSNLCIIDNNQEVSIPISLEAVHLVHKAIFDSPLSKYVRSYINIS